jgi:hypothetical protein
MEAMRSSETFFWLSSDLQTRYILADRNLHSVCCGLAGNAEDGQGPNYYGVQATTYFAKERQKLTIFNVFFKEL